jgi:lipopolysaccharide/colanic/teichoic acid biosynthesis glycosyltransferase
MYKLRSMRVETRDKNGRALTDQERMTVSGRVARKTSIDELPQLINIIKGEMSFIGPRPFLINDLGTYSKEQLIRFDVLPGMSSWTSIHGRANQSIESKYNHEIYYVNNISLKLDMEIFIKTVALVFSQKDVEDHVTEGRIAAEIIEDKK